MKLTLAKIIASLIVAVSAWSAAPKVSSSAGQDHKPGEWPGPAGYINAPNETILQLDLAKEIKFTGRVLRMHYITIAPNGIIGQHSHANRPTFEYVLQGTATETKKGEDGKVVVKSVPAGDVEVSTVGIEHWWMNESREMVKIMAVDIWVANTSSICRPQGDLRIEPQNPPPNPDNIKIEEMGSLDLATQFPDLKPAKDYLFRSRRMTILPGHKTKLEDGTGNPTIIFIVKGEILENRSDEAASIRRTGEYSVANGNIRYFWENMTTEPVVLWVVDIVKKPSHQKSGFDESIMLTK
jgi:quercetin dioxygenase-like cupin family protein